METLIYKCPNCGAALVYDTESGMMYCDHCVQYYPREILVPAKETFAQSAEKAAPLSDAYGSTPAWYNPADADQASVDSIPAPSKPEEEMEMRIYRCNSCGAELMTNDVEVSKFCSYCGQPSILFSRISQEERPKKIIPFKMTKEEALRRVQLCMQDAVYQDESIADLKPDSVFGVYMPYWVIDAFMGIQTSVTVKSDKQTYKYDDAVSMNKEIPLDASRRLNDDISILLNPFRTEELEDFSPEYLSGFYADRKDVLYSAKESDARDEMRRILKDRVLNDTPGVPEQEFREKFDLYGNSFMRNYRLAILDERFKVNNHYYAFMPVYFITYVIGGKTINILVNGQTGKIVGNIPVDDNKLKKQQILDMTVFGVIGGIIGAWLFYYFPMSWALPLAAALAVPAFYAGNTAKKKYLKRYSKMNSVNMFTLSRYRESN